MQDFIRFRLIRCNCFKYAAIAAASIFFILLFIIFYRSNSAQIYQNGREEERMECYRSIQVKSGESLWEISSRYYSSEYKSMKRYIARIKYLNHMLDEEIPAGGYLIIPFYAVSD